MTMRTLGMLNFALWRSKLTRVMTMGVPRSHPPARRTPQGWLRPSRRRRTGTSDEVGDNAITSAHQCSARSPSPWQLTGADAQAEPQRLPRRVASPPLYQNGRPPRIILSRPCKRVAPQNDQRSTALASQAVPLFPPVRSKARRCSMGCFRVQETMHRRASRPGLFTSPNYPPGPPARAPRLPQPHPLPDQTTVLAAFPR